MNYFERIARRLAVQEDFVPASLGAKGAAQNFARQIGVRTPEVYYSGTLQSLPSELPSEFVFKPAFASTSIGVLLLHSLGDDRFTNLTTNEVITLNEIKERAADVAERFLGARAESGIFILEELLRSPDGSTPPKDVRFYAFQGEIGLILMESHIAGPARAMYFDGDFAPLKDVKEKYGVASGAKDLESIEDAIRPMHWKELLAVAKRLSVAIPSAFCRIDLYDTQNGVTLGELTFTPGTFYYKNRKLMSDAEAERLGALWGSAEDRLLGSVARR
ncbi:ATP-grasp fold amidoligase family protein [Kocuria sp. ZOR0020]|uniref:ATP-grasp fold amidoligase family protein n=1 Tax=Kocuria sp. ZOR0020 TaxID=1339234 RepID=UPI00064818C8|nr:ATP-grasp fold amidoligase family protein [Kocuria sp. ZOR0020]